MPSGPQIGLDAAQKGDFATALREWTPLAEKGDAIAQYNLGLMYRQGQGVKKDQKIATKPTFQRKRLPVRVKYRQVGAVNTAPYMP